MNTRQTALIGLTCLTGVACQTTPVYTAPRSVPAASLPMALTDSLIQQDRWAHAPAYLKNPFLRGIVAVQFSADATIHDRELAMRSVNGYAVARTPTGSGAGVYYLKLVVDRPDTTVFQAIRVLRQNSAVRNAVPEIITLDKVASVANRPPD